VTKVRRWLPRGTHDLVALGTLAAVALAVRLPHLTLVPRFTDESLEVLWSLPIARGETFPLTNYDTYYGALFNYLVAGSFLLLGPSALAARLVVLTLGVLTVLATYGLARAWGGGSRLAGLLAGGLLAMNPAHAVINSHIAWANCTTPLFTTLAVWSLWYAVEGMGRVVTGELDTWTSCRAARAPSLVLSGLLWGLALQTHPAVMTLLPGAALYLVWRGRRWFRTGWPYLALAAFSLGYADVIIHNLQHGFESLTTAQRIRQEYALDDDAATGYPSALLAALLLLARLLGGAIDTRQTASEYLLDLPVLLGTTLALAGVVALTHRGNPLPLLLTLCCLVLLPAVNPKFGTLVSGRYLMPLLPIFLAALAGVLAPLVVGRLPAAWWNRRGLARAAAALAALILLLAPLLPLSRYYQRAYATADTNVRAYALVASVTQVRQAGEVLVLDESFGSETGGTSELRALRYLLTFEDVPTRVLKLTPKRLEDELLEGASLLVILSGRQLRDYGRLPLEPLTPAPTRSSDVALFRFPAPVNAGSGLALSGHSHGL
jgi:glycosyltransferase AglD